MSYVTQCQKNKCGGDLYVVSGTFTTRIPLSKDGFATEDAKFFDTSDEMVRCDRCGAVSPLEVR